jgi:hypothetical protein
MEQTVKKGNRTANPAFALKTHRDIPRMSEAEIRENATQFLKNADHGIQTAVCGSDGATLRSVIGLNGSVIILTQLRTRFMKWCGWLWSRPRSAKGKCPAYQLHRALSGPTRTRALIFQQSLNLQLDC